MVVGALYALCVIAPTTAIALGAGSHVAHCFTEEQLGLAQAHKSGVSHAHGERHAEAHIHADGTIHDHGGTHHSGTDERGDDPAGCCGLFGLIAMAVDPHLDLGGPSRHSSILPASFEKLTGRGPDRINRPPIAPLPL
jgi:hypothetical protein